MFNNCFGYLALFQPCTVLFINSIFSQTTASLLTATIIVQDFPRKINKRPCVCRLQRPPKNMSGEKATKQLFVNGEKTTIYFKSGFKETRSRDSILKKIELNLVPRFLSYSLAEREKRTLGTGLNCIARKSLLRFNEQKVRTEKKNQLFFLPAELAKEARNQVFLH